MARSIHEFIQELASLDPEGFRDDDIRALLLQAPAAAELSPYVKFEPGRYTRNLIHRTGVFELLVLCWAPGVSSEIHNHGGQRCWFRVEAGTFEVRNYDLLAGGREPGYALIVPRGAPAKMGVGSIDYKNETDEIHRVGLAEQSGPAISLHVYAAPVDRFLVYDPVMQRCALRSSSYDDRSPAAPAVLF